MNCFNFSGDIYGCNRSHSPSIKGHLRPLNYDTNHHSQQRDVRLDHVRSSMGEGSNSSHICDIQLSYSQYQREDAK